MDGYFSKKYVESERILYTPSTFARKSLIHLQEIGELAALRQHESRREKLESYLFFSVEDGSGRLIYKGAEYPLKKGGCVFINCKDAYAHETSEDLWRLKWVHFNGAQMAEIYEKYKERGGKPAFAPENISAFHRVWSKLFTAASSSDHIRDMRINEGLNELLTLLMEESWHSDDENKSQKRKDLVAVKDWLEEHYAEKISLDDLAERFYINKYYLTRIFKEQYGASINRYLLEVRITHAKKALRFTDETIEQIGYKCGLGAPYYFCRMFKKVEGMPPSEFRDIWKS
ncbi:MAG: helix-turn-helix transcriptional regulator [Clostridia bacterium]|nr:helix-turn-helix transcriptional regulator [Clostridia bacterium]